MRLFSPDELTLREEEFKKRETKLTFMEGEIISGMENLQKAQADFAEYERVTRADLEVKAKEIADSAVANQAMKEALQKERVELNDFRAKLLDERAMMDRNWNEIKMKEQAYANKINQGQ